MRVFFRNDTVTLDYFFLDEDAWTTIEMNGFQKGLAFGSMVVWESKVIIFGGSGDSGENESLYWIDIGHSFSNIRT
jgi:hypothetical protein